MRVENTYIYNIHIVGMRNYNDIISAIMFIYYVYNVYICLYIICVINKIILYVYAVAVTVGIYNMPNKYHVDGVFCRPVLAAPSRPRRNC